MQFQVYNKPLYTYQIDKTYDEHGSIQVYNKPGMELIDHYTYTIAGDGRERRCTSVTLFRRRAGHDTLWDLACQQAELPGERMW